MRLPLPKIRELIEAVKAVIVGPYTSSFPGKPHVAHKNFRGQPKFNEQKCVGCYACEEVCPAGAIAHEDVIGYGKPVRKMIHYTDTCIFCGECERNCIADKEGIKLSTDWDLAFFDRKKDCTEYIEKELQLCEICGEAVATKDHLTWIGTKLGELTFSNPTLYLSRLRELRISDENLVPSVKDNHRADRVKILCARCRRATTLTTK